MLDSLEITEKMGSEFSKDNVIDDVTPNKFYENVIDTLNTKNTIDVASLEKLIEYKNSMNNVQKSDYKQYTNEISYKFNTLKNNDSKLTMDQAVLIREFLGYL